MIYSRKDMKHLLSVAEEASRRAGELLSGAPAGGRRVMADTGRDIKIAADTLAENIIVRFLQKEAPLPMLTEESGALGGRTDGLRWIVDPLDGTINFFKKIPLSCVSIGLWDGDAPVLGVVYDFNRSELFSGIASGGSWLNGRKITVSAVSRKDKAVLLTGLPSKTDFSVKAIGSFIDNIRSFKKVRLLGSAALSLAYVASGRADVYCEKNIMIWDIAGGVPIVLGAGGACRTKTSADGNTVTEHAANPSLLKSCRGGIL